MITSRDDVDHTTNGVSAVKAAARATYHLDTFDAVERNRAQRRVTVRGAVYAQAVDQNQRLIAIRAANVNAAGRLRAAIIQPLNTVFTQQRVRQGAVGQRVELVATNHAVVAERVC